MADSTIHDLGYERYRGPRTSHRRRFWVIARNVFAVAWRSKWGVRLPLFATVGTTIAAIVILYVLRFTLMQLVTRAVGPATMLRAEVIHFGALQFFKLSAFVLATVVATAAIANDLRMGAFQFYFSRPIRRGDYVLGKLLGLAMIIGIPMFAGPVVVSIMVVVMAWSDAGEVMHLIGETMLIGVLGTVAYTLPAAALGALLRKRQAAQALFAIYFLLLSTAAVGLSIPLRFPWLRLVSLPNTFEEVAQWILDLPPQLGAPPVWAAAASLAAIVTGSFALIWWRVSRAETAGLGQ